MVLLHVFLLLMITSIDNKGIDASEFFPQEAVFACENSDWKLGNDGPVCYGISPSPMTYDLAIQHCNQFNSTLVSVKNQSTEAFIFVNLLESSADSVVWIGVVWDSNTSQLIWLEDNSIKGNYGSFPEQISSCINPYIRYGSNEIGVWNFKPCIGRFYAYSICSKKAKCISLCTDFCSRIVCQNGGTCSNLNTTFKCSCRANTTGATCEVLMPFYTSWSEWENFTQPCGQAFRARTRNCTDLSSLVRQSHECDSFGPSDESQSMHNPNPANPCRNGGVCSNVNTTFQCSCKANITGVTCDTFLPFYTSWGEWENFTQPCGQAFWARTRNCTDLSSIVRQSHECDSFGPSEESQNMHHPNPTNPCRNGGVCSNVNTTFQCSCQANITGLTCETFLPFFTSWSEWRNFTQPCGQLLRLRTRQCTDLSGIFRESHDCTSFGPSDESQNLHHPTAVYPCKNGGVCSNVNTTFQCSCQANITGLTCETFLPFYTSWSEWRNFTQPCGQMFRTRMRNCTDASGAIRQIHECASFGADFEHESINQPSLENRCRNGGTCHNTNETYECSCLANTTGSMCDVLLPYYDFWSEWTSPSQLCGQAVRSRTRNCTDLSGVNRPNEECLNFGSPNASEIVQQRFPCSCITNPCQFKNGKNDTRACNVNGETLHLCAEVFDNTTFICSYQCICAKGYQALRQNQPCTDIDECASTSNICTQPGNNIMQNNVLCVNTIGSYKCTCKPGYENPNRNLVECRDVDECLLWPPVCGDPDRITCTNTPGSYSCRCKPPFVGDGKTCLYDKFMHKRFQNDYTSRFGLYNGDDVSPLSYLPLGGYLCSDDWSRVINSMYATKSGLIIFTNYKRYDWSSRPTWRQSFERLQTWSRYLFFYPSIVRIAAVYWSPGEVAPGGGVYVKFIDNLASHSDRDRYLAILPDASWAYIVTWHKMTPYSITYNISQTNTFQAVVVGDKHNRVIKAQYIYQDRQMGWNLPIYGSRVVMVYPAHVGVMSRYYSQEYRYSGLNVQNYPNPSSWNTDVKGIAQVDGYFPDGSLTRSIAGGIFTYFINNLPSWYTAPYAGCQTWVNYEWKRNSENSGYIAAIHGTSRYCEPYFERRMDYYGSYMWRNLPPLRLWPWWAQPRCLYHTSRHVRWYWFWWWRWSEVTTRGWLVGNDLNTIRAHRSETTIRVDHRFTGNPYSDSQAYSMCCDNTYSGLSTTAQCDSFMYLRPGCSSSNWHWIRAFIYGDPHISTLDGLTYTFNGHGEYVLVTSASNDFLLQARMSPTTNSSTATVFTGFAAQVEKSTILQININPQGSSVELWLNKTLLIDHNWNESETFDNIKVYKEDDLYVMWFYNGVIIKINATLVYQMLTVSVSLPDVYSGKINGLMGNWNGIKEDDICDKNNSCIPSNSTEEEIFYVAETWRTTENSSLFSYPDRKSYDDYNNLDYIPLFFNEDLTILFPNDTERLRAINLCYREGNGTDSSPGDRKECYLDFAVTKNADFVAGTVADAEDIAETRVLNDNNPPVIYTKNVTLKVQAGLNYSYLITINATDADEGDMLTFNVIDGPIGLSIDSSGAVSWYNVIFERERNLTLSVSDNKTVTVITASVIICDCKNGGSCLYEAHDDEAWSVAQCDCPPGWVGEFCEEDFDGCSGKPCFSTCYDVPAQQVIAKKEEYICAACPEGLTGDGKECYDINECLISPPLCEHKCENTAESFICSCLDGYTLETDLKSCMDIDECLLGKDECGSNSVCNNTNGSYLCICKPGFSRYEFEEECNDIDECSLGTFNCPAGAVCINLEGNYKCICPYGYTLSDGQCVDADECTSESRCQQICKDGKGAYTCGCYDGFVLNTTDRLTCIPKIPCNTTELLLCDNGNFRSQCGKDDSGEILCYCPKGYARDKNQTCHDIDECNMGAHSCQSHSSTCRNTSPGYVCECLDGYERSEDGVSCIDTDECGKSLHNCSHGCTNFAGSFTCTCLKGYKLGSDGENCIDIDECRMSVTNLCDKQHGLCINRELSPEYPLGYICSCKSGFILSGNSMTCIDENECRSAGGNNCTQGCYNEIGSYSCFCDDGYKLNDDGMTCDDINECAAEIKNLCYDSSHCLNLLGGYNCSCPEGFQLKADGFSCEAVQKCSLNNCSHSCSVNDSKIVCLCPKGLQLSSIDNTTCIDVDECLLGRHTCNQSNNVHCVNEEPGYTCECLTPSYKKISSDKCIDVDECSGGLALCQENSICINKENGYDCVCKSGYILAGSRCHDRNECLGYNECNNINGTCQNTEGGYRCICKPGYTGDGVQCDDINECLEANSCAMMSTRGFCINTNGSHTCQCYAGFKKSLSNTCEDINECEIQDEYGINCSHSCINTIGSWKCSCPDGYLLGTDGRTCLPLLSCPSNFKCQQDCSKINGTATCTCRPGYQTDSADKELCADINECLLSPSVCDPVLGECTNTIGSYICSCKDGYIIGPNNQCRDRNGNFSDWTTWTSCSHTCGKHGVRWRVRECNNPTREGKGLDCLGKLNETEQCNKNRCPEQDMYSVLITLTGISVDQLETIQNPFSLIVVDTINTFCAFNTSQAQMCCNTEEPINRADGKVFITREHIDIWSEDLETGSKVNLVITVMRDSANDICSSHLVRKRSLIPVEQKALFSVFRSLGQTKLEDIVKDLLSAVANINVNLTVHISLPESNWTSTTTTTSSTTNTTTNPVSVTTTTSSTTATGHANTAVESNLTLTIGLSGGAAFLIIVMVVIIVVFKKKHREHKERKLQIEIQMIPKKSRSDGNK